MKERIYIMVKNEGKKVTKRVSKKTQKPVSRVEAEKKIKESLTKEQQEMVNDYIKKLLEDDRRKHARILTMAYMKALHDVQRFGKVRLSDTHAETCRNIERYLSDKRELAADESSDWYDGTMKIVALKLGVKK